MSRLTDLIRQARRTDEQLGKDLEAEIAGLMKRRTFGLVFERHRPEAVELPQRQIRRGDKVRVLPPRGDAKPGEQRVWRVAQIQRAEGRRVASLMELDSEEPETQFVLVDNLVVVAEFRDRIYPGLIETGKVERGGDKPFHSVINAENYHALQMLTYTHRHAIDAIYIDPPYNTGAKDWKYNNNYVEADDDYRHSKWLAFMERRLTIARELLDPEDSVLVVTIDEKEVHRLGLLLEQIFPQADIQMVTSSISPQGSARPGGFARVDEQIFFCRLGKSRVQPFGDDMLVPAEDVVAAPVWFSMIRSGTGARREDSKNLFYPIFVDSESRQVALVGDPLPLTVDRATVQPPSGHQVIWPIRRNGSEGRWQLAASTFADSLAAGFAKIGEMNNTGGRSVMYVRSGDRERIARGEIIESSKDAWGYPVYVRTPEGSTARAPKSIWNKLSHDAGKQGSMLVGRMLNDRKFPFPKSLYAIEDTLRFFVKDKPTAVILDFFAGSGTTAHAVMRLNRQDGGRRQCISVTNNEVSAEEQARLRDRGLRPGDAAWEALGICDHITKPRISAAITGKTPQGEPIKGDYKFTDEFPMADGLEENAAFFTLTYEAPLSVRHNRAFERIAPMLWMRAGARGRIIKTLGMDGWDVADAYGVLEDLDHAGEFLARATEEKGVGTVFIVTDDDSAFQMVCRDLPSHALPVRLYESYLQNFAINIGMGRDH